MSTPRKFGFAYSILISAATKLNDALNDTDYQADMAARLSPEFIGSIPTQIGSVTGQTALQHSQTGDISQLTKGQNDDLKEMNRLASGARDSAKLAFPDDHTILHAEFQVGEQDSHTLPAMIERARLTHSAAVKYATELATEGWIAADATALETAITTLEEIAVDQDDASDDRLGITNSKVIASNTLYDSCRTIQNAANLQYPGGTDSDGNERNVTARARFLLDEFPPRHNSTEDPEPPTDPEPPVDPDPEPDPEA